MNLNKTALCAAALLGLGLLAQPAKATDFGVFGAYQDTKDADSGYGAGVKLDFARFITLRATYFGDVTSNTRFSNGNDFKLRVVPLEAGLQYKFQPDANVSPYLGGGASYFLLDTNRGNIDDELGWFAVGGVDIKTQHRFGVTLEAIYRSVDATVHDNRSSTTVSDKVNLQLRGFGANAGLVWHF
ncbi:MAG TPA: OmpW family outer membrane protein [Thermoanaerobaculia bacterium]|nr:OmpW family outer membrane protein [Thermoanaerobaculia bacterium]